MTAARAAVDTPYAFNRGPLHGDVRVPGDKSLSHRALILGAALAEPLAIENLNTGFDVSATSEALRAIGADVTIDGATGFVRPSQLHSASDTLDCRNSGSTARMMLGVCAGANLSARLDGDESLRRRPMEPVAAQLRAFGALIETEDGYLPATMSGTPTIQTRDFILLFPSAQVKSALLFAALFSRVAISIINDAGSRDHTERLLEDFGAQIRYNRHGVEFEPSDLTPRPVKIPGDFSAAAFFIVAATIVPGSVVRLRDVGVNPTRTGLVDALRAMGASIVFSNERQWNNEPVADIEVKASALRGASFGLDIAARAIDEIPVLAVAAACADGITRITGLRQLRQKESDRLLAIEQMLKASGVSVEIGTDDIQIAGPASSFTQERRIDAGGDHRIVMAAAPLAAALGPIVVAENGSPDVSFPNFMDAWSAAQAP